MTRRTAADGVLTGVRVRTLDPQRPWADAVAWRDGAIVAVGGEREVLAACDARTARLDGAGGVVTPGLVDAHIHALWSTELSEWVVAGADLREVRTLDQLRRALVVERERVGPGGWIRGWGLDYAVFAGESLRGALIEQAVAGQPALLRFFDAHTALASAAALAQAGVTGPVAFADGAEVVCVDGRPTGALVEHGAIALVASVAPQMAADERRERSAGLQRELAAVGLTGAHVMDGAPRTFALLRELEARDEQLLRMVVPLWIRPDSDDDEIGGLLALRGEHGRRWRGGVVKLLLDGVVETGTAWLVEPDVEGEGTEPYWPDPERYAAVVARAAAAGMQCVTHAIGDRAILYALDAYAAAGAAPGIHHRVEHLEVAGEEVRRRLLEVGAVASMQAIHLMGRTPGDRDPWSRRLSAAQRAGAWPIGDLVRGGATVALGSDWPVAPYDPRLGMAWARLRRAPGQPELAAFEPSQRLDGLEALHGYTRGAALAVGEGRIAGRIAPGFRADLSVFADDPVVVGADDLPDLPVTATVVDGVVVHRA